MNVWNLNIFSNNSACKVHILSLLGTSQEEGNFSKDKMQEHMKKVGFIKDHNIPPFIFNHYLQIRVSLHICCAFLSTYL